jgi:hypothetical protein
MDTQAIVGSEAGKLSGHDVRRVMLHVVQRWATSTAVIPVEPSK